MSSSSMHLSNAIKDAYAAYEAGRSANLDKVPASGATLVVGLAKVKDSTGGPVRLMALV